MEMNVLPSELIVEVIAITGLGVSFIKYFKDVLMDLNDSDRAEPGLATTGNSWLSSL
jgi:hypothetical protein